MIEASIMIPVIALVGRPNVGKSTLFNRLTHTRDALVADFPGLTRDRIYGQTTLDGHKFIIIDTGGIDDIQNGIETHIFNQSLMAIAEANLVLFIVDSRDGLMPADNIIANHLRIRDKITVLVANKIDGMDPDVAISSFYSLGFNQVYPISSSHGRGISEMIEGALIPLFNIPNPESLVTEKEDNTAYWPYARDDKIEELVKRRDHYSSIKDGSIKIVIVGRPNVGKSTLTNCILEEERVVVYNTPGTTRDSIYIPMIRNDQKYILIDTAGVRKRGKVINTLEKFSIIKTMQAIEYSNVTLLVIDAYEGVSDQDLSLLRFILNSGRALVIIVNKWDGLSKSIKNNVKDMLDLRLGFVDFARIHFISALYDRSLGNIFQSIQEAYKAATQRMSTALLTRILSMAQKNHQPAFVRGRRAKLKYAHAGGYNPPIIIIHGNQVEHLTSSYKRYLTNYFRHSLQVMGTPISLQFKKSNNPYLRKT
ncbi:GTPase Der [Candidatus Profftia tarda]|uniref:GTPase Der n=1 Tax=Candidatus Profftia tarda TaxID=1177216 RepID=A0A8E4F0K2_9ENTR|nr:GTPase Der [Candidatus Profftia tarda]